MASNVFLLAVLRVKLQTHSNALVAAIVEALRNGDEETDDYAGDLAADCHALHRLIRELEGR